MNVHALFGGMQHVPGLGYVQSPGAHGALGDESAVMMISGLGSSATIPGVTEDKGYRDANGNWVPNIVPVARPPSPASLKPAMDAQLKQSVTLFNVTLPLWAWLIIAAALGGAGGYYLGGRR